MADTTKYAEQDVTFDSIKQSISLERRYVNTVRPAAPRHISVNNFSILNHRNVIRTCRVNSCLSSSMSVLQI